MADRIELANSGRAKCRGCGSTIPKGALRFGESVPNQFAEGETLIWFHLDCAAYRRPEKLEPALAISELEVEKRDALLSEARLGIAHPRATRAVLVERAPSGRAKCRHCPDLIEKGALRIKLEIFQEARFEPIGYIHLACHAGYFGTPISFERLARACASLPEADIAEVKTAVAPTTALV